MVAKNEPGSPEPYGVTTPESMADLGCSVDMGRVNL